VVAPNSWIAIGYGSVMHQTDMAFWNSEGNMTDMYAVGRVVSNDPVNNYNSTWNRLENGSMHYNSTRPLAPSSNNSYVIPLDTEINMIVAWFTNEPNLIKHGPSNRFVFKMTLFSNGTASANGGIRPLSSGPLV